MVQFAGGVSTFGNTAGNTGTKFGTIVLAGTNNVTLSQISGSAGVHTIQISAAGGGGGGGVAAAGVSTGGNTSGNTGTQTGTIVFQATGNLTASQVTGAGGVHTVQLSADGPKLSIWANHFGSASAALAGTANATLLVFPLCPDRGVFPGVMTVNTMAIGFSASMTATASSSSHTHRFSVGIYTLNNSTQLGLLNFVSTSVGTGAGNTGNSSMYHGPRLLTIHSSAWNVQPVFTQTQYWVALWIRSSNLAPALSLSGFRWMTSLYSGHLGVGNTNSTSSRPFPGMGVYSVSFTSTAMPAVIGFGELLQANANAPLIPTILFNNHGF
jgi:hypothetical protein